MTLRVVGAGLGRTGTTSLKAGLEFLLEAPCYHMDEVYAHPEHVEVWRSALRGDTDGLSPLMEGYAATVDWPAGAFWRELSSLFPHALVVLTVRESAEAWWRSANSTILEKNRQPVSPEDPLAVSSGMIEEMMSWRFTPDWNDRESAMAAYERHNESVRQAILPGRLLEWKPDDGWEPLCARLGLPVPETAFPHKNSAKEFRGRMKLDQ
ncbi:MAG: sulfotransferase family protein [Bauldia sp.]|nr:sulfotransferase family protein [Bauldia sp.]